MKRYLYIIVLVLLQASLFAQPEGGERPAMPREAANTTGGVVKGYVTDDNAKPLEYALVYVLKASDSTVVTGVTSQKDGNFLIEQVPFGDFLLKVESMGYKEQYTAPFTLTAEKPFKRFPKIALSQKAASLEAVDVTAKKEMLQTNLDKTVYNVESSIVADGATAVEVLEDIPSVSVDLEGNVSVRGSDNVTILVNNRPTNLTLEQIPADMIESIELVTNPSARYEPDGMAGILNVVLKKKKEGGFNGLVSLRIGAPALTYDKKFRPGYNANLNLNYSYDKINVFFNYSYRGHSRSNFGELDRLSWMGEDSTLLEQTNKGSHRGNFHNIRTGIDWFINSKNTLNLTLGYNFNLFKNSSRLDVDKFLVDDGINMPNYNYIQNSASSNQGHNFSVTLDYLKTFAVQGRELSVDLYYTQMSRKSGVNTNQLYDYPEDRIDDYQASKTLEGNRDAVAQVDFVTPVGNGGRIETGYKFSWRSVSQDYSYFTGNDTLAWAEDMRQRNDFVFNEMINAAYFIYSNTFWKKLKVQVGLRGEIANTWSNLKSANLSYQRNYYNLFPTVHIRYDINHVHSLQVSYSRRVSRPRIHQLNPFLDISDKENYRQGNPDLKPEFVNSVELGYLINYKKSSFNFTLFYRHRSGIVTRYTELMQDVDERGVPYNYTLTSYKNLRNSQNYGIEAVYNQRLWKFWKITLNGNFYRVIIDSDSLIDESLSSNWEWGIRLNQTFTLPKNWDIQLNFRYRSPSLTTGTMGWGTGGVGQGKRNASYSLNLGIKKSFFKDSFSVSFNIRDLIFTRYTKTETVFGNERNGYNSHSVRQRDALYMNLTLSYKINNYKIRKEKNFGVDESEEME
ncbi:MAG: TonB-dependent receptor [Bacteroidales bacterium]|nr:TonB-dependent receptor [Bacteroidales bacterium]